MLPWICSVTDHRGRQNVVKTKEVAHHRQPKRTMFGFGLQRSFWSEYTRINLLSDAK